MLPNTTPFRFPAHRSHDSETKYTTARNAEQNADEHQELNRPLHGDLPHPVAVFG